MFGRYSERAQRVIILAQDEARRLQYNYVGTEHILLGLLREQTGIATQALRNLGVDLEGLRAQVEGTLGRGTAPPSGEIQFTPRGKRVIMELAIQEAREFGHSYVGTEHLLLGIMREGECAAARMLEGLGAQLERVRQEITKLLGSGGGGSPVQESRPSPAVATSTRSPLVRASAIVFDSERRLLLVGPTREQGRWHLPGGAVRPRELACEAAVRHVRDQTGLEVACGHLGWVIETLALSPGGNLRQITFVYAVRPTDGPGATATDKVRYYGRDEIPDEVALPPQFWAAADAGFQGHDPGVSRRVPAVQE